MHVSKSTTHSGTSSVNNGNPPLSYDMTHVQIDQIDQTGDIIIILNVLCYFIQFTLSLDIYTLPLIDAITLDTAMQLMKSLMTLMKMLNLMTMLNLLNPLMNLMNVMMNLMTVKHKSIIVGLGKP